MKMEQLFEKEFTFTIEEITSAIISGLLSEGKIPVINNFDLDNPKIEIIGFKSSTLISWKDIGKITISIPFKKTE
ncbi:MAG: hypothetical protein ABIG10_01170 [bacterium]